MNILQARAQLSKHFGNRYWSLELSIQGNSYPEGTRIEWRVWDSAKLNYITSNTLDNLVSRVLGVPTETVALDVDSKDIELTEAVI